jgi:hypothetical protein
LEEILRNGEGHSSELAAVILAKVKGTDSTIKTAKEHKGGEQDSGIDELVGKFRI